MRICYFPDKKMSSRCAHGEGTRADFHARMRSLKHTVKSAYEIHGLHACKSLCLPALCD